MILRVKRYVCGNNWLYDPIQKVCRDDCLTWNNEIGCVPITEENIENKAKGLF